MKPGLSLRRGKTLTDAERLAAVSDWTQEPAVDVAQRVGAANPIEMASKPVLKASPDPETGEVMPWVGATGAKMTSFRLPERIHLKLKWLGETTYGTNATKLLCEILEPELNRMIKARGIEP